MTTNTKTIIFDIGFMEIAWSGLSRTGLAWPDCFSESIYLSRAPGPDQDTLDTELWDIGTPGARSLELWSHSLAFHSGREKEAFVFHDIL